MAFRMFTCVVLFTFLPLVMLAQASSTPPTPLSCDPALLYQWAGGGRYSCCGGDSNSTEFVWYVGQAGGDEHGLDENYQRCFININQAQYLDSDFPCWGRKEDVTAHYAGDYRCAYDYQGKSLKECGGMVCPASSTRDAVATTTAPITSSSTRDAVATTTAPITSLWSEDETKSNSVRKWQVYRAMGLISLLAVSIVTWW